jgi:hypothetical protein
MAAVRHHTVPCFLLERFAQETARGTRVCQLEVSSGRPAQVGPRSAAVRKHFYSLDIDGRREPAVEEALGKIESVAAPLIRGLAAGEFPRREQRAELALFIAMSWLRTPVWRAQMKSLFEQMTAAMTAETYRRDPAAVRRAFAGTEWESMSDDEAEAFRTRFVSGLDSGDLGIEMPVNLLIKHFLQSATSTAWVMFALDWTLVRTDSEPFILADTPVSLYDPTPFIPGGGSGILSSPNVQVFLPLDPSLGILLGPSPELIAFFHANQAWLAEASEEERSAAFGGYEGSWAEGIARDEFVRELNLRSYAHAQRYVYGSQGAVCGVHAAAKANRPHVLRVTPLPPRIHLVEDDPAEVGRLRVFRTFSPRPDDV